MLEAYRCLYLFTLAVASATAQTVSDSAGPNELKYANVEGTRLAYTELGRGVPVILVHGAFADHRYWSSQLSAAAEEFRVIAYSRRDFHPNARDSEALLQTADRDVEDLIELIEVLGAAPAHLVGHSAGGHVALVAAIRRPDLVRSIVLEEGGFVADHPESMQALAETQPIVQRALQYRSAGARESGVRLFIDFVSGEGYYDSAPAEIRRMFLDNEPALGLRPGAPLTCAETQSVSLPVLMVLGERSPPYINRLMSGVLDCLRGEQAATIPAASHGIHYEQPEAFNRAVFRFLAEH